MPTIPISKSEFGNKRFKRYDSYAFAGKDAVAPLVLRELVRASAALPIAFVRIRETVLPVAILGLGSQKNLFVASDGRWIGRYVPSVYRGYPFSLAKDSQDRQILCFDEGSGLLSDTEGESFFSEDGKPTVGINNVLNFLTEVAANRQLTERIGALLLQHGLLEPWSITVETQLDEPAQSLDGLMRVKEDALGQLTPKDLHTLHQNGALPAIYYQLSSMQHLAGLENLAKEVRLAEKEAALPKNEAGDLDLSFLADDTTISFEDFDDL